MAARRFNPLDPLGLFEHQESPQPERQAEITKFLADIRKLIPDEAQASQEYTRLANEARRLGFSPVSRTLLEIAGDEGRHRVELEDITIKVW